jgi:hypothetical protein
MNRDFSILGFWILDERSWILDGILEGRSWQQSSTDNKGKLLIPKETSRFTKTQNKVSWIINQHSLT